jgi:small subunit ribosomal protein S20
MANHFSALKRARQTTKRTATNRANASRLRTALRGLRETIDAGDKAAAEKTYRETVSALDKAIQKGTLHANTAARYKSRLNARLVAMK